MSNLIHGGLHPFYPTAMAQYLIIDDPSTLFSTVIFQGREKPIRFTSFSKDEVISFLDLNQDLIGTSRQVSLFETKSISSLFDKKWIYKEEEWESFKKGVNLTGKEITDILCNFISNRNTPEWLEACRGMDDDFFSRWFRGDLSDVEIINAVSLISFRTFCSTKTVDFSLKGLSVLGGMGTSAHDSFSRLDIHKDVDCQKIVAVARETYKLGKVPNQTIEDGRTSIIENYLGELFRGQEEGAIQALVSKSGGGKSLFSNVQRYLSSKGYREPIYAGMCGSNHFNQREDIRYGLKHGRVTLSESSLMAYHFPETKTNADEVVDLNEHHSHTETYEGVSLWNLIYAEYEVSLFSF